MKKGFAFVALVLGCSDALEGGPGTLAGGHTPDGAPSLDATTRSGDVSSVGEPVGATSCRGSGMPVAIDTVESGEGHACTIGPEGDVYCWGRNDLGQLGQGHETSMGGVQRVLGLGAPAVALAAGRHFTCALSEDGVIACWGLVSASAGVDLDPDEAAVVVFEDAKAFAAHEERLCAVLGDGQVWCRTLNSHDDGGSRGGLRRLDAAPDAVRSIAMHSDTLCAVTDSGGVWCGSLSPRERDDSAGMVAGLVAPVSTVVLGRETACALTNDYEVMCWPHRVAGPRATEVQLDDDTRVLVAGDGHLCALNSYGGVHCWGDNRMGQAVPSRPGDRIPSPFEIPFDIEVVGLSTGPNSTCAHFTDGATLCWGDQTLPEVHVLPGAVMAPGKRVPLPAAARHVDAGPTQTCAALWNGTVMCWGRTGPDADDLSGVSPVVTLKLNDDPVERVHVGHEEGCAAGLYGGLICWGVEPISGYSSLIGMPGVVPSAGFGAEMSCTTQEEYSSPICWGEALDEPTVIEEPGTSGLGPPFSTSQGYLNDTGNSAVTVGDRHACVVRGFMPFCWGDNTHGQVDPRLSGAFFTNPIMRDDLPGLRDIAAGARHTCVLFLDGGVRCFGDDALGQLGDGVATGTRRTGANVDIGGAAIAVAAGTEHTCAVRTDGRVFCWGQNDHGQIGAPSSPFGSIPVAVPGIMSAAGVAPGETHTCVLLESGAVTCFGALPRVVPPGIPKSTTATLALWTCDGVESGHVGLCASPPTASCDDGNPCTDDACEAVLGCSHVPRSGACGGGLVCQEGQCVLESAPMWSESLDTVLACDDPLAHDGVVCEGNGRCFDGACVAPSTVVSIGFGGSRLMMLSSTGALHGFVDNLDVISSQVLGMQGTGEVVAGGVASLESSPHYNCVTRVGGDVTCWGYGLGEVTDGPYPGASYSNVAQFKSDELTSPIADLASGPRHLCAAFDDGNVACLGWNDEGQLGAGPLHVDELTNVPGLPSDIVEVAVGETHTCARSENGDIWCLGGDREGQVGDGALSGGAVPRRVEGLGAASQLVAADSRTCALVEGEVWCWGASYTAQVGPSTPVHIGGFSAPVVELGLGTTHACARLVDGTVECWGSQHDNGLLGNGRLEGSDVPVPTSPLASPATQLVVGPYVTAALLEGGDVVFWGDTGPAVHDGQSQRYGNRAQTVDLGATLGDVKGLFASQSLMCAKGAIGETACWGTRSVPNPESPDDRSDRVGSGTPWLEPVYTTAATVVEQVLGHMHECRRYADGSVACSGRDQEGQLGNGEPREDSHTPVVVTLPEPAVDLEAAFDATCAILESGALACWGSNEHGLMGNLLPEPVNGDPIYAATSTTPRLITGLAGPVRALSLSARTACLIVESGDVYCAGDRESGATGLPGWESDESVELMRVMNLPGPAVAITTSYEHSCAAFEKGGVTCWGGDFFPEVLGAGQWDDTTRRMHVFGFSSPVTSLRSDDTSTCALTTTGRVVCWGAIVFDRPIEGEYGSPWSPAAVPGLLDDEAVALQMTWSAACVRTQKGVVKCWGNASYGQLGDGRAFEPRRISGIWPGSPSYSTVDLGSL